MLRALKREAVLYWRLGVIDEYQRQELKHGTDSVLRS